MDFQSLTKIRLAYKWWVTIAVTLGLFMSLMDSTIVIVAIPQMQKAFGADIHSVQWVVTIYMLTQAAVIPTAPYLTARFGGKKAYIWSLSAFLLGSLLCGFAWNLPTLILFRLIQGIGGGILLPLVMTLLYQAFPPEERGTATSIMGIPLMIAPMLGPVMGGYLISVFGWPWAFFINVPVGIVAVVIAQKFLLQAPLGRQKIPFDTAGFLTAACGSALLLYAVSNLTSANITTTTVALLCASIASLARIRGDRTAQSTIWASAVIGSTPLSRSHLHVQYTYSGLELFCQVRHSVPDPHLPANASSRDTFASRSNPGISSCGYHGNTANRGKACRSLGASSSCDGRVARFCHCRCLTHDAHLDDTNLEDCGNIAPVGLCFWTCSADSRRSDVTYQEGRAARNCERLYLTNSAAGYRGSPGCSCFLEHRAGAQPAVYHASLNTGDNG